MLIFAKITNFVADAWRTTDVEQYLIRDSWLLTLPGAMRTIIQ